MADGIKDIGGFLDSKGNLIQEPLSQKSKSSTAQVNSEDSTKIQLDNGRSLDNALGAISSRTREGIDRAIAVNDGVRSDLDQARSLVKEQRKVLRQLEKETGSKKVDEEKVQKLKDKFESLEKERSDLSDQISSNNRARLEDGSVSIRVGNKQLASFRPQQVEFSKSRADLTTPEGIAAAQKEVEGSLDSIKSQIKESKQERQAIAESSTDARNEISSVAEKAGSGTASPLRSIDDATRIANNTSELIRQLGAGSVSIASNGLTSETVSRLLQY